MRDGYLTTCAACGRQLVRWLAGGRFEVIGAHSLAREDDGRVTGALCGDCDTWVDVIGGRPLAPEWTADMERYRGRL